jgi:hypothetical protein
VVEATENAIAVSSDEVVEQIKPPGRQNAEQTKRFPRPPERAGDEEHGACLREQRRVRRTVVRKDIDRRQFLGVMAVMRYRRRASGALERREVENAPSIAHKDELHQRLHNPQTPSKSRGDGPLCRGLAGSEPAML